MLWCTKCNMQVVVPPPAPPPPGTLASKPDPHPCLLHAERVVGIRDDIMADMMKQVVFELRVTGRLEATGLK